MGDEILIEAVKARPCLWQIHSRSNRDLVAKDNAWLEIATQIGGGSSSCTPDLCNKRWKAIRERYVRELKKTRQSGDDCPAYVSTWPFFDMMEFLKDTVRHKRSSSTFLRMSTPGTYPTNFGGFNLQLEGDEDPSGDVNASVAENTLLAIREVALQNSTPQESLPGPSVPTADNPVPFFGRRANKRAKELNENKNFPAVKQPKLENDQQEDGDAIFGDHVASRLRQFTPRQKAIAYIEIDRLLLKIQYPNDPYFNPRQQSATNSPLQTQIPPATSTQSIVPSEPKSPEPNYNEPPF